jgi:adenosylcobinamide kinase/adenosylcobinamide-phosphate guanylyltransferase
LAEEIGGVVLFVATAEAGDEEMAARIAEHRAERPKTWQTLEAPRNVGRAIREGAPPAAVILIDCLTLLASNVITCLDEPVTPEEAEATLDREIDGLLEAYAASDAAWIIVSNEVGSGLVPPYPLGRIYRDALGRANARLAREAEDVLLMVAGLPLALKKAP